MTFEDTLSVFGSRILICQCYVQMAGGVVTSTILFQIVWYITVIKM